MSEEDGGVVPIEVILPKGDAGGEGKGEIDPAGGVEATGGAEFLSPEARVVAIGEEVEDDGFARSAEGAGDEAAGEPLGHGVERAGDDDEVGVVLIEEFGMMNEVGGVEGGVRQVARGGSADLIIDGVDADVAGVGNAALDEIGSEIACSAAGIEDGATGGVDEFEDDVEPEALGATIGPEGGLEPGAEGVDRVVIGREVGSSAWFAVVRFGHARMV